MSLISRLRNPYLIITLFLICAFIAINSVAYIHARAMVSFSESGVRTESPEELDLISKIKVLATGITLPRPLNSRTPADLGLAFEARYFPGNNNHIIEAWHVPAQSQETVVLLFHGYADSKDTLLPIVKAFHELDHSALLVDFFGSGGSNGNDTTIGYLEANDVSQTYRFARQQWPDATIVLYGYSMGGAAVLRSVATDDINPDAIIVEATYDTMLNTVKNRFTSMGVPSSPFAQLLVFWGGWQAGFDAFGHNPADYATSVDRPTLVIHGANDPRVTTEQVAAVYQQLSGWKKLSTYQSDGHKPVLIKQDDSASDGADSYDRDMKGDLIQWRKDIKALLKAAGAS